MLRSGLYQRLLFDEKDGAIRPLLNVDVKHRAFPCSYPNLIDLLHAIQKEHKAPRLVIDFKQPLNKNAAKILTDHLTGLEICYKDDTNNNGILKFLELGHRPAKEGKDKTVQRYFAEHGLRIKYPELQCIRLGIKQRYISVPLEYCTILGDQVSIKKNHQ